MQEIHRTRSGDKEILSGIRCFLWRLHMSKLALPLQLVHSAPPALQVSISIDTFGNELRCLIDLVLGQLKVCLNCNFDGTNVNKKSPSQFCFGAQLKSWAYLKFESATLKVNQRPNPTTSDKEDYIWLEFEAGGNLNANFSHSCCVV